MSATASTYWPEQADDPDVCVDGKIDAQLEEEYWQSAWRGKPYSRAGLDYEDFAPAYCVGYIGCAQYGGSFDEAEKSLLSNWVRIKGASRLGLEEAMQAIRAAWDHAERSFQEEEHEANIIEFPRIRERAPRRNPEPAYATA